MANPPAAGLPSCDMDEALQNAPDSELPPDPSPRDRSGGAPGSPPATLAIPILSALAGLALFVYPMYVIRPFRAQGTRELAVALAVKQAGPWLALGFAALAVGSVAFFWNSWRWVRRTVGILFALVAVGAIALTRFNVYEQMFHPMGAPSAEPAATAKIDSDDMVMAVNINRTARAYPIRTMGYHHIANDWVGGEPIVATY